MYGLIGKMLARTGKREDLLALLTQVEGGMPGCLSYIVARDPSAADALWVTEIWNSKASHAASLELPEVKAMIARARPLLAGFGERFETEPVGGIGLSRNTASPGRPQVSPSQV